MFLPFFITWDLIWHLDSNKFALFLLISNEICQDNPILITYSIMLQFWKKKLLELLKITILGPYLGNNWASMGQTQNQGHIFYGNNKKRSQAFKNFYFIKISYVLTELWIIFYFGWCFVNKKGHSQQIPLCKNQIQFFCSK